MSSVSPYNALYFLMYIFNHLKLCLANSTSSAKLMFTSPVDFRPVARIGNETKISKNPEFLTVLRVFSDEK